MNKTSMMSIVAAAGLAVSGLASAAAPTMSASDVGRWYIGAGVNYNAIQKDRHKFFEDTAMFELDDHDIGFNLLAGKRLTNHFANEVGFNRIGDTRWKLDGSNGGDGYMTFKIKDIYHIYYDGYFFMPLMHPSLEAFAKGGVSYIDAKNELQCRNDEEKYTVSHNTIRTFALNYGAGVQFTHDQFGIRGEYTRVVPNHDSDLFHAFTDTINLDFIWYLS